MVALDVPTIKASIVGQFGGGEIWNTGFWLRVNEFATPPAEQMNDLAEDIFNLWGGIWLASLDSLAGTGTKPLGCRTHYYPQGSLVSTQTGESLAELAGGTQTQVHPYQVGVVCSLRTPVATRRTRGRMYLPLNAVPTSAASGQYSADVGVVADAMQAFFNEVNNLLLGGTDPLSLVVASHASGSTEAVTSIRVDSVPDVQRRRVNALVPLLTENRVITA